jgi:hypothetical protein
MEDGMNDCPHVDLRPAVEGDAAVDTLASADTTWDVVREQLDQALPRLTALGARVAVLAPALIGIIDPDSFGRGIGC